MKGIGTANDITEALTLYQKGEIDWSTAASVAMVHEPNPRDTEENRKIRSVIVNIFEEQTKEFGVEVTHAPLRRGRVTRMAENYFMPVSWTSERLGIGAMDIDEKAITYIRIRPEWPNCAVWSNVKLYQYWTKETTAPFSDLPTTIRAEFTRIHDEIEKR